MLIVTGHLTVDPGDRERYLDGCRDVIQKGRYAKGCLDFAISADLLDDRRINILERWESAEDVQRFRGDGVGDEQAEMIHAAAVAEYEIAEVRELA